MDKIKSKKFLEILRSLTQILEAMAAVGLALFSVYTLLGIWCVLFPQSGDILYSIGIFTDYLTQLFGSYVPVNLLTVVMIAVLEIGVLVLTYLEMRSVANLFSGFARDEIFTNKAAENVDKIANILIILAFVPAVLCLIFGFILSYFLNYNISLEAIMAYNWGGSLVFGFFIKILAFAFKYGVELEEDKRLTV